MANANGQDYSLVINKEGCLVAIFHNWFGRYLEGTNSRLTTDRVYNILTEQLPYTRPWNNKFKCYTPRDQFACGDVGMDSHGYSGVAVNIVDWKTASEPILGIMDTAIQISRDPLLMGITHNAIPNSCLVNYYRNGTDYTGYHEDKELKDPMNTVYTITLGQPRKFSLKHKKTSERVETLPLSGDLLVMTGKTQDLWKHTIPKTTTHKTGRISLTYRVL